MPSFLDEEELKTVRVEIVEEWLKAWAVTDKNQKNHCAPNIDCIAQFQQSSYVSNVILYQSLFLTA